MIDKQQAWAIAEEWVKAKNDRNREFLIVERGVLETSFGWVFPWALRELIETGNIEFLIPGCAPIIVDKCDGSIHKTGTAGPIEWFIAEYEKTRTLQC